MKNPIPSVTCAAACFTLFSVLFASLLPAQEPVTKDDKDKKIDPAAAVKLEVFTVTGSRIARVDYETPAPVITYTAVEIEDKGYATLGEFVSNLSFNSDQTNSEITLGSFVAGAGTSNPRGLGSNRFLTLINGRRGVPYALTNGINGSPASAFNFNSIPAGAVDRIEYLKDGASAIYGSDAITGVMNVILKRNYSGASVDLNVSNSPHHDMLNRRVSLSAGGAKNGWQVFGSLSHRAQHSSFIQDYGTHSTFFSYMGAKGANQFSTINQPSYVTLNTAQAALVGLGPAGVYVIPNAVKTANPKKSDFVWVGTGSASIPVANRFDFGGVTQMQPDSEQTSGHVSLERKLNDHLTAFASVSITQSKSYYDTAQFFYSTALNGFTLTADNPYNPFGIALTAGAATPVAFTVQSGNTHQLQDVYDLANSFLLGVRGTTRKTWTWESAMSYGVDRAMRSLDYVPVAAMRTILSGTTRTTAFNPFGPSDNPNILKDVMVRAPIRNNIVDAFTYDLSASGKPWQIPLRGAGELGVATGYEFREEDLRGHPDGGSYVGFSPNFPFHGRRHVNAVYAELSLPLQKWLEFDVAGRHELYSDFGHATKPKYSGKLNLPKNKFVNVLLRASYSESFKAPDLGQTHQARTLATTSVTDPLRPGEGSRSVRVIQGGNPDLKPEEGKVQYLGFVFEVPAIKGLSFTADYLDIQIRGAIFTLTIAYLTSPEGLRDHPEAITRGPNLASDPAGWPGPITEYRGITENLGFQLSRTWDFGVRYSLRTERYGSFNFNGDVTNLLKRGIDRGLGAGFSNATGRYNAPIWRSNLGTNWRYRNFSTSVSADVVGKFYPGPWGENVFAVINTSVSYGGFKGYMVSLGANNAFNHRPPQNGFTTYGYDERGVDALGANGIVMNLRVRRDF